MNGFVNKLIEFKKDFSAIRYDSACPKCNFCRLLYDLRCYCVNFENNWSTNK
jgi:hypothetical protein